LLQFLESNGFKIGKVFGRKRFSFLKLVKRVIGSLAKFLLAKLFVQPYLIDNIYSAFQNLRNIAERGECKLIDPSPDLFPYKEIRPKSNLMPYEDFIVYAHKQ